jgi:hypothetical protein
MWVYVTCWQQAYNEDWTATTVMDDFTVGNEGKFYSLY